MSHHGVAAVQVFFAPHGAEQLLRGYHLPLPPAQIPQDIELGGSEGHLLTVQGALVPLFGDAQGPDVQPVRLVGVGGVVATAADEIGARALGLGWKQGKRGTRGVSQASQTK